MLGIVSYGSYIPYRRLTRETAAQAFGKKGGKGAKAVAYCDEDSLTMAVAAALRAEMKEGAAPVKAVYAAGCSAPYTEKQSSTGIAAVLDLPTDIRTADFAGSLRAGSAAVLSAMDYLDGHEDSVMVTMSDCRLGAADGKFETELGDGAAAFLLGKENVLAEIEAAVSFSRDMLDEWRGAEDRFLRNWDVRYANSELYSPMVRAAADALFAKTGTGPADYDKLVLYGHDDKNRLAMAAKLGFAPEQTAPSFFSEIGNTGNAAAAIMLCHVLDEAKPGEKILLLAYGEGCDAFSITVTPRIESFRRRETVLKQLAHKDDSLPYGKYLKWKQMVVTEPQKRPAQERSALPDYQRNFRKNHAFYGSRCTICGTPVFPPQRVCVHCHSIDKMEPYRFYDKEARIRTFTVDGLSLSLDSPNILVVIEFEGGGKMMTYLTDCDKDEVRVGMKVRPSYRKMFEAGGVRTYFWKVVPAEEGEA